MGSVRIVRVWSMVVLVLHLCCTTEGLVPDGDILMEWKNSILDVRGSLSSWGDDNSTDPCDSFDWIGVTCANNSASSLSVQSLDLRSKFLSGPISSRLGGLENLVTLDLTDNCFSGPIPDNLTNLQRLENLRLGDNVLEGPLPSRFPPQIHFLELQNNFFTGNIGLTNLHNLTIFHLQLQGNWLFGKLPDMETGGLKSLERLDLSGNQFEGSLPSGLSNLDLFYCNMSGNKLTGQIPQGRWNIGILDLSGNRLNGPIPAELLTSSSIMTYFNCSGNLLSGELNMTTNTVPGSTKFLDLSNNKLEGPIPAEIGNQMASLEYLGLQENGFTGNIDSILRSKSTSLRELRLGGNKLTVGGSLALTLKSSSFSYPALQVMDLSNSGVAGSIPSEFFQSSNLPLLRVLDLSRNGLEGTIPVGLFQMPLLEELRLRHNLLGGTINVSSHWTSLVVLDLSHNRFSFNNSQLEVMLENFTNLRELRLGSNNSTMMVLLSRVGVLGFLETLDLSESNLNGNIPATYSDSRLLPSLVFLNLSHNSLDGGVPGGFANMTRLTHLDLSYNNMSGPLPVFPLSLFNSAFYVGNQGLCGPPLAECPRGSGNSGLKTWVILIIVIGCVLLSGGSCLLVGWIWRRRIDRKLHEQDVELIAALLDRDTANLMPLRELRRATEDFSEKNQIGVGGFGTVYRGVLENGTEVAIKKNKRDGTSSEDKTQFLNEVKILSQVHHRNLVRLLGCCLANKNALLVFEFVPNGTLQEHLQQKVGPVPLSWSQRLRIAGQTASALDYLHSSANPPIYHLDVKSANILLDTDLNAKVADFGISRLAPAVDATHITAMNGLQGTVGYMDPESVVSSILTGKSDVYAFGVVLLELITAKNVVDRSRGEASSLVKWATSLMRTGKLESIMDPAILDTFHSSKGEKSIMRVARLAEQCLNFRPEDRPMMKVVCKDLLDIQQRWEANFAILPATMDKVVV